MGAWNGVEQSPESLVDSEDKVDTRPMRVLTGVELDRGLKPLLKQINAVRAVKIRQVTWFPLAAAIKFQLSNHSSPGFPCFSF